MLSIDPSLLRGEDRPFKRHTAMKCVKVGIDAMSTKSFFRETINVSLAGYLKIVRSPTYLFFAPAESKQHCPHSTGAG